MISLVDSLVLGVVEGLTEFLPISSTAHLILASKMLSISQSAFVKTFEIAIQSGAILAVIWLYWKKFLDIEILKRLLVAFLPTALIGLTLYKVAKNYLLGNIEVVLWALVLGGIVIIIFEKYFHKKTPNSSSVDPTLELKSLGYKKSVFIGVAQAVAIIPGVSRSAATIIGGMIIGLSREAMVEFSFLLAVPTILAATGLDLLNNLNAFTLNQAGVLSVGFIVSFVTAVLSIKFLLAFIKTRSFISFGIYRIVLTTAFALIIFF